MYLAFRDYLTRMKHAYNTLEIRLKLLVDVQKTYSRWEDETDLGCLIY